MCPLNDFGESVVKSQLGHSYAFASFLFTAAFAFISAFTVAFGSLFAFESHFSGASSDTNSIKSLPQALAKSTIWLSFRFRKEVLSVCQYSVRKRNNRRWYVSYIVVGFKSLLGETFSKATLASI